jgi:hypothetical protein
VRLFHIHVEGQLAAQGHPDHSWSDDLNHVAASMMASLERTMVLLYRRHFEHYVLAVTVLRAEAALERAGLARRRRRWWTGPGQRFARNCATRNLTSPQDALVHSASDLAIVWVHEVLSGVVNPPAHRWHARGQGFDEAASNAPHIASRGIWARSRPRVSTRSGRARAQRSTSGVADARIDQRWQAARQVVR